MEQELLKSVKAFEVLVSSMPRWEEETVRGIKSALASRLGQNEAGNMANRIADSLKFEYQYLPQALEAVIKTKVSYGSVVIAEDLVIGTVKFSPIPITEFKTPVDVPWTPSEQAKESFLKAFISRLPELYLEYLRMKENP